MAIVQVPPYDPARPLGGAEVVCTHLVGALGQWHDIVVIGGCWREPRSSHYVGPVRVVDGFRIDGEVRTSGLLRPRFSPEARDALASADVLVSFERALPDVSAPAIVFLGGVGAPHTVDLLRRGSWTMLVVPSRSAADASLRAAGPRREPIVVIPNAVDLRRFVPGNRARTRELRFLLPARPVIEKGLAEALLLCRAIDGSWPGREVTLTCFDQGDTLERSIDVTKEPWVRTLPWMGHDEMAVLYRSSDMTLCLSSVDEGFGLAVIESIASGTPVLATRRGNLNEILPPGCGLYWVGDSPSPSELASAVWSALREGSVAVRSGRKVIQERYSLPRFERQVADLVALAVSPE